MQDPNAPPKPINAPGHGQPLQPAIIVYALYGAGIFIPFAALAGLIYAYVERGRDPVLDSHLNFQIATFWWGLLMMVVGFVLAFIIVGFLVWAFWIVWLVVRLVTGFQLAQANRPVSAVETFGLKAV
ncbi:hypothetical protein KUL25_06235 [Rhodobacteraceae bacterium N5(2021)]|uniref:DUF4870 domain-containing protein n=1 Tax=Gymnodinialimonas phycosphaerae TaxID=2841589 RepID=A0A975YH37_9RHOB|nr:hypothetical protein [Gymnodinialimonas phycosphaerae]MBY4892358.1 hypothetical protein [Gymnodinialimonas phycosphaerae]